MDVDGTRLRGWGLTDEQDRFVRLIAQGVNNSGACPIVGINGKTGTRWRFGRTIRNTAREPVKYAPRPPKPRHQRFLSSEERLAIADMLRARLTVREIARQLDRSPATVSRELRRNTDARGRYLPGGRRADRHRATAPPAGPSTGRRHGPAGDRLPVVGETVESRAGRPGTLHRLPWPGGQAAVRRVELPGHLRSRPGSYPPGEASSPTSTSYRAGNPPAGSAEGDDHDRPEALRSRRPGPDRPLGACLHHGRRSADRDRDARRATHPLPHRDPHTSRPAHRRGHARQRHCRVGEPAGRAVPDFDVGSGQRDGIAPADK
jgi:Helix-turn-helix domain